MRTLTYAGVAFRTGLILFRRYAFDSLSGLITLFIIFMLIFFGARSLMDPGQATSGTLASIVVGFLVWFLAVAAYGTSTSEVIEESMAGTFEQRALSPLGLARVLVVDFVANIGLIVLMASGMLVLMMAVSGRWLNVDAVSLVPLVVLTLIGVYGVGLALSGVAIVAKRVQSFLQIVQFAFVAAIAAPIDRAPWVKYLPLTLGNHLIRRVMVEEASIFSMAGDVAFLVVHSAAWFGAGLVVFRLFEEIARDRALLGHY